MSLPNIPNITPQISLDREEVINMLLSSIAMEEIGLSHIINAEGEKLQHFLRCEHATLCDYLEINNSINKMLQTVVSSQILLQFKLEDVASLQPKKCHRKCKHKLNCKHYCRHHCNNDCDSFFKECGCKSKEK